MNVDRIKSALTVNIETLQYYNRQCKMGYLRQDRLQINVA